MLPPILVPGALLLGVVLAAKRTADARKARPLVDEPCVGSVVYCKLLFVAEHSGIYVGDGEIVWFSGDGEVVRGDRWAFIPDWGSEDGAVIYVSCKGSSPVGAEHAAMYAEGQVGEQYSYSVSGGGGSFLFNGGNCHQFTSACLTRDFLDEQHSPFFSELESTVERELGADNWRRWEW